MTGDLRRPGRPEPIDDTTIEQLVRDVASGWTMPAVRLDAPSWRDRVRSPRMRRLDSTSGWLNRVGRAATGAVALTLVGALLAVVITRQPLGPGKSAEPTNGLATPAPTGAAAVTPLPKHGLYGVVPTPSTVLTELEEGDFALVDLETGERGPSITSAAYGSILRKRADGTLMCLCVKLGTNVNARPTEAEISLDRFDPNGTLLTTADAASLAGAPDPRDVGGLPERPPHLTFDLQFSEGGRFGIIGWSVRRGSAWLSGIRIIEVATGDEVSHIDLPEATSGEGDTRQVVMAPRLLDTAGAGGVTITREWYSWSPPRSQGENFRQDTDVFRADLAGGVLSEPVPLDGAKGCGERLIRAGSLAGGGRWLACTRAFTNQLVVRRLDADGGLLDDTPFSAATGVDGDTVALSPDGGALYLWNPMTAQLARVDLATGVKEVSEPLASGAVDRGPLAALGAWLAPSAAAKTFLYGGILVSPDGTRVYAIGIRPGSNEHEMGGSAGIYVFDASTLASLGHWEPEADYISLGISVDGRYVYAAGLPRVDASGTSRPGQQASITVHAAGDGAVEMIAGQLGGKFLMFSQQVLE